MNIPSELKYTKDHEWIALEGNIATIGITDFAQRELGDIVFIDINSKGKTMAAEEIFGTVEAVKTVSDLFLPVKGTVTEINQQTKEQKQRDIKPEETVWARYEEIFTDNYNLDQLMNAEAYAALVG